MKNLLNKTILRNLQDYKITHRTTGDVIYLPTSELQTFIREKYRNNWKSNGKIKSKIINYKFSSPEQRKAAKICNICDYIAVSCALIGITIVSYHFITL